MAMLRQHAFLCLLLACLSIVVVALWAAGGNAHTSLGRRVRVTSENELWRSAAEALRIARSLSEGIGELTPESYEELAKLRQEAFCRDSAAMLDTPVHTTPASLGDSFNTTVVKVHPLPAYVCVYGGSQDIVSSYMISGQGWESHDVAEVLWALKAPLPSNATSQDVPPLFVDVGANVGAFSLLVAASGYQVAAFEGMAANQRLLRTALCLSHPSIMQRMSLHAFGLGAAPTTCYLTASVHNRGDGIPICGAHNRSHAEQMVKPPYTLRGTMDVRRLDDVIQRDVKVVKIDVEGYEPFVIAGAKKLLREHRVW